MKELDKSPFITALLTAAVGVDVDQSNLRVYEVSATSTVQFRGKKGTIFENGQISPNTISQLATSINNDPVPVMMDHCLSGPAYGKFFYAESIPQEDGQIELRGYIYIDNTEEMVLGKIESGSIDEVSIQFASQAILCSECGFDFLEAVEVDNNVMPMMAGRCENGHEIGVDGVHARLVGVREILELSLVSRGAAKNSKIIGRSDAMLGESAQRLAASGLDVDKHYYCTTSLGSEGAEKVNLDSMVNQNKELNDKVTSLTVDLATNTTKLGSTEGQLQTETARADAAEAKAKELQEQLDAAEASKGESTVSDEAVELMVTQTNKQYIALKALEGEADAKAPESIEDAIKYISENNAKLTALIPEGGIAKAAGTGDDDKSKHTKVTPAQLTAFKSNG